MQHGKPNGHDVEKAGSATQARLRSQTTVFLLLAGGSIVSAVGFSTLQELVFNIPGFTFGGWMTFLTYVTYATCGCIEGWLTKSLTRHAAMKDFFIVSILAMGGAYFTNAALNYVNYTTRIVFKSCRVLPVMLFRSLVVGTKYSPAQYMAGAALVAGIALFTSGDADGLPSFSSTGVLLITLALVCDAMTANLEERQFFRIKNPCTHAEVMMYLSCFAALESFLIIHFSGELQLAMKHSEQHPETVGYICAFSVLGYITVCLILLIIKGFGATNAEIVKSLRKVCQVVLSFMMFPKPLSWKYAVGGAFVVAALYWLQRLGKRQSAMEAEQRTAATGSPAKA